MKPTTEKWLRKFLTAIITGVSHAGAGWTGLATANAMGADIPVLHWKAFGYLLLTSGIIEFFKFLSTSPLPEEETLTVITTIEHTGGTGDATKPPPFPPPATPMFPPRNGL